jgi:UDP-N-acetylmuramoylalanine-D-glutamate ligase
MHSLNAILFIFGGNMEKKEFMQKLSDLFLEKKKLSMKGENTEIIDKQIKDLKKEYSKDLMEEKRNDQYKRK